MEYAFIHNPKTGGETIEILLNIKKNHDYPSNRNDLQNKFSFVFVRNPITRLISWYNHLRKGLYFKDIQTNNLNNRSECYNLLKKKIKLGPEKHRILAENNNIDEWIRIILTNKEYYSEPCWGPLSYQYNYVFDNNGTQLVNKICKFENYKNELTEVLIKLNKNDKINQIEKTNHSINKSNRLQNDTIELIYEYFKKDFIAFDYTIEY